MTKLLRCLLSSLLISSLTCSSAWAIDLTQYQTYPQQQQFEYSDFSKLLYSNLSPYKTPDGTAIVAQNLRANQSVGALSKRPAMTLVGTDGTGEITSLYRYYNTNGNKYLVETQGTVLDTMNDSTGAVTILDQGLTSGKRWTFTTFKNNMIAMNGSDNAQKWDGITQTTANTAGSRSAGYLTADLGAPFAVQAVGGDLTASKWYQYRMAYKDGNGTYYYSTNRSNPIQTGSSVSDINLTDIPIGAAGITDRYIYRTTAQNSQAAVIADNTFYQLVHIANNSATTYSDTSADGAITGDAAPTWATVSAGLNITVPKGKYCLLYQEFLWIAGDPNAQSFLYYSNTLRPDWFDANAYEQVRPDDGDVITFLADYLGILTIGKTNTISKLYTNNSNSANWILSDPFSFIGCPAPYSVAVTPLGIVYLGRDGIYQFTGQTSQLISDVVTDKIRDINQVNIGDAAGTFFRNEYHLSYTSTASGSATNNEVLVLDVIRNAYELDTENISSWSVLNSGTDLGILQSGSSSDGKIYAHSTSATFLNEKTQSDLNLGTVSYVDILGTQNNPTMSLGWGGTWATATLPATWSAFNASSTWIIQSQTGTWTSPAIQINASAYQKLYWNQSLGANGTITFAIRSASTSGGIAGASWSSEFSNPAGSDISALSANTWVQIRATLTTTDWVTSPSLYLANNFVVQMVYTLAGSSKEASFLTLYNTGFNNWGHPGLPKIVRSVDIYYTGTVGTITVGLTNSNGDINLSIPIDLTQIPPQPSSMKPWYKGSQNGIKMYHFEPPVNTATNSSPVGQDWQLTVNDNSINTWDIKRIVVSYDVNQKQTP